MPWILIVISGSAKVCRTTPDGKSLILCYYISSGLIGDIELMMRQKNATTTVKAITALDCIAVNYPTCADELSVNLRFLNFLGGELAAKLSKSSDNYTLSALCSGEHRLCTYILQNSHKNVYHQRYRPLDNQVSQPCRSSQHPRQFHRFPVSSYPRIHLRCV